MASLPIFFAVFTSVLNIIISYDSFTLIYAKPFKKKKKNLTCTLDCTGPEDGSVYQHLFACGL